MDIILISPQKIYIGDLVTVQYTLQNNAGQLPLAVDLFENAEFLQLHSQTQYTFRRLQIQIIENKITVYAEIIPWIAGEISVPPLNLQTLLTVEIPVLIPFPKILVQSITEELKISEVQPPVSPIVLPGTMVLVYGTLVGGFICLFLVVFLLLHFATLRNFFKQSFSRLFRSKKYVYFLRHIRLLEKKSKRLNVKDFSAELMRLVRTYLEEHFHEPFLTTVSSEISSLFNPLLETYYQEEITQLENLFHTLDYIRFSGNATNEERISLDDKKKMIHQARFLIQTFETNNALIL